MTTKASHSRAARQFSLEQTWLKQECCRSRRLVLPCLQPSACLQLPPLQTHRLAMHRRACNPRPTWYALAYLTHDTWLHIFCVSNSQTCCQTWLLASV